MLKKNSPKIKPNSFKLEKSKLKLIKSSGLLTMFSFFQTTKLPKLFFENFKDYRHLKKTKFTGYDYIILILFQLLDGHVRTFQHRLFSNAHLFKYFIQSDKIPHFTSVIKFLSGLPGSCLLSIKKISLRYAIQSLKEEINRQKLKTITIDVDATAASLFGKQEGVNKGYNPQDKNEKCIQLQLWTIRELKLILFSRLRPGNTHCNNGLMKDAKILIPELKKLGVKIRFFADSGYADQKIYDYLDDMNVEFVIAQKQFNKVKQSGKFAKNKKIYIKYKAVLKERKKKIGEKIFREIYINVVEAIDSNGQLLFPQVINEGFTNVLITNMDLDTKTVYRLYRKHAIVETIIEEIKNDFGILKSKSHKFRVNQFFAQMICLAYNFKTNYARIVLNKKENIPKMQTIRDESLHIPGYTSNNSGYFKLNVLDFAYKKIKKIYDTVLDIAAA